MRPTTPPRSPTDIFLRHVDSGIHKPPRQITFHNTRSCNMEEVGRLFMRDGQLHFEGNVEETLKVILLKLKEQIG